MEKRNNSDAYIAAEAVADRLRKTQESAGKEYFDLIDEIKLLQKLYKEGYNLEKLEEFRKESDILGTMVDPKQVYGVGEELKKILMKEVIEEKSHIIIGKKLILLEALENPNKWFPTIDNNIKRMNENRMGDFENTLACFELYELKRISHTETANEFFAQCRERDSVQKQM